MYAFQYDEITKQNIIIGNFKIETQMQFLNLFLSETKTI